MPQPSPPRPAHRRSARGGVRGGLTVRATSSCRGCAQRLGPAAFTGLKPRLAMISVMTSAQFFVYDGVRTLLDCPSPSM